MGDAYRELKESLAHITQVIKQEEERYQRGVLPALEMIVRPTEAGEMDTAINTPMEGMPGFDKADNDHG